MEINESKPVVRQFDISVNADELRLIEEALMRDGSMKKSGDVENVTVWQQVHDFLKENGISRMTE